MNEHWFEIAEPYSELLYVLLTALLQISDGGNLTFSDVPFVEKAFNGRACFVSFPVFFSMQSWASGLPGRLLRYYLEIRQQRKSVNSGSYLQQCPSNPFYSSYDATTE